MVQFVIFFFLGLPTILLTLVFLFLFFKNSTLFLITEEEVPQYKKSVTEFSQPGLSRFQLNRIVRRVNREDRRRRMYSHARHVHYYTA